MTVAVGVVVWTVLIPASVVVAGVLYTRHVERRERRQEPGDEGGVVLQLHPRTGNVLVTASEPAGPPLKGDYLTLLHGGASQAEAERAISDGVRP